MASLLALEIMTNIEGKHIRFSRLFTYYLSRKIQNRVGLNGAELSSTLRTLCDYGAAPDMLWPFHINKVNREPAPTAFSEAIKYKIGSFEYVDYTAFNQFLDRKIPIIIGFHTSKMFWRLKGPLSKQIYKPINTLDNRNYKGHAVTIVGYDNNILGGSWIVANSAGLTWGDHGYGILPYECYTDIGESYVITKLTPERKISEF